MKNIKIVLATFICALIINIGINITTINAFAGEVDIKMTFTGSAEGKNETLLGDGEYDSAITFQKDDTVIIDVAGEENIKGLYIIWNSPVKPWMLKTDNGDISCGKNGFLHEYINVESETDKLEIVIPDDNISICDIRVFGEGQLPDDVQVWNPPCYEKADIMLISSHADDELLFFGGIIPVYSILHDANIQVVYMTEFWSTQKVREHEKLDGLWATGLDIYPVCGDFMDKHSREYEKACSQYDEEELTEYITKVLRQFKPQVVVTHDFDGEYGHGFHMLVAHCTAEAVEGAADVEFNVDTVNEYGVWDVPKTYIHLYDENKINLDLSVTIEEKQGKTALQLVKDGYDKHVSQHKWDFYVSDTNKYSCAAFGLYRTKVGVDSGNDILENIKTYKVQEQEEMERIEKESLEQASREQESKEKESLEQESREQASREEASREEASREKESLEEASRQKASEAARIESDQEQSRLIMWGVIVIATLMIVAGGVVVVVKKKRA